MAEIRKIRASLVTGTDVDTYVGESTYLFYDIISGSLRMYDGTPGGIPLLGGGSGITTVQDEGINISTAATLLNFAGAGVIVTEPGAPGELLVTIPSGGVTTWGDIIGTVTDQTDLVTYIDTQTEEEMFAQQVDFINDDLLYRGEAVPGTATSAALWRIRRITIDNSGEGDVVTTWAGGTADFDKIWDNRLGLTYT